MADAARDDLAFLGTPFGSALRLLRWMVLVAVLVVGLAGLALLLGVVIVGPYHPGDGAGRLAVELWWILVAALPAPLWCGRSPSTHLWRATAIRRRRRVGAAAAGSAVGLLLFFAAHALTGYALADGRLTLEGADNIEVAARWVAMLVAGVVAWAVLPHGRPGLAPATD